MRAVLLGSQSFIDGGTKVGTQYLAQALAAAGWQVDYVPTLSSPFDVIGRQRHGRLRRAWIAGGGGGYQIEPGLTEWSIRALFPAHRFFMKFAWQPKYLGFFLPDQMRKTYYDVCIAEVAPNILIRHLISSRLYICRLNDWPKGFSGDLHPKIMQALESTLFSPGFDEIWAVSNPLVDYVKRIGSNVPVVLIPNGVEARLLASAVSVRSTISRRNRSAVYVGGMNSWLDSGLLREVARYMPDWHFDIYGPGKKAILDDPPNLHWRGSVLRSHLSDVLQRYEVGLIPFSDVDGRMSYVERPLKFYEYVAAGLGVASTDFGSLRKGMGSLATYGNGTQDFARAICAARDQAAVRPLDVSANFVRENSWEVRTKIMLNRLEKLLA